MEVTAEGKIDSVNRVDIFWFNVLDREDKTFTCEFEVEADLVLDLEVEIDEGFRSDQLWRYRHRERSISICRCFIAQVVTEFDQRTGEIEFPSIYVGGGDVELTDDQIERCIE